MKRAFLLSLFCLTASSGFTQGLENDSRVRVLAYAPGHSWQIQMSADDTVLVLLSSGEHIQAVRMSAPTQYTVSVTAARDGLFLKPTSPTSSSTMRVDTGERSYGFQLSAGRGAPPLYVVSFNQPVPIAAPPPTSATPTSTALLRTFYKLEGDKSLWPRSLSDDGSKTYITWDEARAVPAVFGSDRLGHEETINAYMRGGIFTIDRVYERLTFRIDKVSASATRASAKKKKR